VCQCVSPQARSFPSEILGSTELTEFAYISVNALVLGFVLLVALNNPRGMKSIWEPHFVRGPQPSRGEEGPGVPKQFPFTSCVVVGRRLRNGTGGRRSRKIRLTTPFVGESEVPNQFLKNNKPRRLALEKKKPRLMEIGRPPTDWFLLGVGHRKNPRQIIKKKKLKSGRWLC